MITALEKRRRPVGTYRATGRIVPARHITGLGLPTLYTICNHSESSLLREYGRGSLQSARRQAKPPAIRLHYISFRRNLNSPSGR